MLPDLDLDLTPEDFDLDLVAAPLEDLSHLTVAPPPEQAQDDRIDEGRGGLSGSIAAFVRPTKDALAIAVGYALSGKTVTPGFCLRETRLYFNVGPLYAAAKLSLAGAKSLGVAHRVEFSADGVKKIPRGGITYWVGPFSQFGHVAPSLGAGACLSTDWPTGRYGRVNIYTLAKAWGYTEIWWAPCVNDVRVWEPRKPNPAPTPLLNELLAEGTTHARQDAILKKLAKSGEGDRPGEVSAAATRILDARKLRARIRRDRAAAKRKGQRGRQALQQLKVAA